MRFWFVTFFLITNLVSAEPRFAWNEDKDPDFSKLRKEYLLTFRLSSPVEIRDRIFASSQAQQTTLRAAYLRLFLGTATGFFTRSGDKIEWDLRRVADDRKVQRIIQCRNKDDFSCTLDLELAGLMPIMKDLFSFQSCSNSTITFHGSDYSIGEERMVLRGTLPNCGIAPEFEIQVEKFNPRSRSYTPKRDEEDKIVQRWNPKGFPIRLTLDESSMESKAELLQTLGQIDQLFRQEKVLGDSDSVLALTDRPEKSRGNIVVVADRIPSAPPAVISSLIDSRTGEIILADIALFDRGDGNTPWLAFLGAKNAAEIGFVYGNKEKPKEIAKVLPKVVAPDREKPIAQKEGQQDSLLLLELNRDGHHVTCSMDSGASYLQEERQIGTFGFRSSSKIVYALRSQKSGKYELTRQEKTDAGYRVSENEWEKAMPLEIDPSVKANGRESRVVTFFRPNPKNVSMEKLVLNFSFLKGFPTGQGDGLHTRRFSQPTLEGYIVCHDFFTFSFRQRGILPQ